MYSQRTLYSRRKIRLTGKYVKGSQKEKEKKEQESFYRKGKAYIISVEEYTAKMAK